MQFSNKTTLSPSLSSKILENEGGVITLAHVSMGHLWEEFLVVGA
jgi:hypothetical protein